MIITGHKGFIGRHLFQDKDVGIDLPTDILDCEYKDDTIHLAALTGIADCEANPFRAIKTNLYGTYHIAKSCGDHGAFLLFASSQAADHPDNLYGLTKEWGEEVVRRYAEFHCIMRFSNVYGPGSEHKGSVVARWCKEIRNDGTITLYNGKQERDFIYIDDLKQQVEQITTGMRHANICTGRMTTLETLANLLRELTGARIIVKPPRNRHDQRTPECKVPTFESQVSLEEGLKATWEYFNEMAQV